MLILLVSHDSAIHFSMKDIILLYLVLLLSCLVKAGMVIIYFSKFQLMHSSLLAACQNLLNFSRSWWQITRVLILLLACWFRGVSDFKARTLAASGLPLCAEYFTRALNLYLRIPQRLYRLYRYADAQFMEHATHAASFSHARADDFHDACRRPFRWRQIPSSSIIGELCCWKGFHFRAHISFTAFYDKKARLSNEGRRFGMLPFSRNLLVHYTIHTENLFSFTPVFATAYANYNTTYIKLWANNTSIVFSFHRATTTGRTIISARSMMMYFMLHHDFVCD